MDEMQKLLEELQYWKKEFDKVNQQSISGHLEKVKRDDKQEELQKEFKDLISKKTKLQEDLKKQQKCFENELSDLHLRHDELREEEAEFQKKLDEREKAVRRIQDNLFVNSHLPLKNMNFRSTEASAENQIDDEPMDITYTCNIISGHPFVLGSGQALLTFEDEEVAKSVIARKKHSLEIDDKRVNVEAQEPRLGKSVKFEVNMNISRKKIKVSNLPEDIPEEILEDKVELAFYKSGIGGAEIEQVDYDKYDNTACIKYLQTGVAQRVLKRNRHQVKLGGATCDVKVMPCMDIELSKLQMFSAVSSRSVLLTGIKNVTDQDEDDVQDIIQIHFQKESNGGGEVENIMFSQDKKLTPIFEQDLK